MKSGKPEPPKTADQRVKEYHKHLDSCWRCRENPFNPCEKGVELLLAAGGARPRHGERF